MLLAPQQQERDPGTTLSSRMSSKTTWRSDLSAIVSKVDVSAGKGILVSHDVGRLKHFLPLKCMWFQEAIRDARIQEVKTPQVPNAADGLASACGVTDFVKHIHNIHGMNGSWTALDDRAWTFLRRPRARHDKWSRGEVLTSVPQPTDFEPLNSR